MLTIFTDCHCEECSLRRSNPEGPGLLVTPTILDSIVRSVNGASMYHSCFTAFAMTTFMNDVFVDNYPVNIPRAMVS